MVSLGESVLFKLFDSAWIDESGVWRFSNQILHSSFGDVLCIGDGMNVNTRNTAYSFRVLPSQEAAAYLRGRRDAVALFDTELAVADAVMSECSNRVFDGIRRSTPINAYCAIESYGDLFWFVDEMIDTLPVALGHYDYECDKALLSSIVGMVFDIHDLFAKPYRKMRWNRYSSWRECQFEWLDHWADIMEEPMMSVMMRMLRDGSRYDKERRRFVPRKGMKPLGNGIAVTQWGAFMRFDSEARSRSFERCRILLKDLSRDGRDGFVDKLVADHMTHEIYLLGCA